MSTDLIPRCAHGAIILGCPDDDCTEQVAYLARQNAILDAYYEGQRAAARKLVRGMLGLPTSG